MNKQANLRVQFLFINKSYGVILNKQANMRVQFNYQQRFWCNIEESYGVILNDRQCKGHNLNSIYKHQVVVLQY